VSSLDDRNSPPLPDEVRFAISAFRTEQPSPHQQARIHAALQAAEYRGHLPSERAAKAPERSPHFRRGLWVMVGAALASVLLTLGMERTGASDTEQAIHEALPLREVNFQVPEGGGWVVLPWNLNRHPDGLAEVHLETPAELDFHRHSLHPPTVQLVSCEGERCLHEFTAEAGDGAEALRVRIHRPGRYMLNVSHASEARQIQESFLVRAVQ
jgi:hypothetical protein